MLCKPKSFYDEVNRVSIGYKNPFYLSKAKQVQPALYNGHEIVKTNHARALVHDSKDTLEIAETTRKQMIEKIKDLKCGPTFVVDKKCDEIERKNLLIENENLIAACLSKDVFYTATYFVLTIQKDDHDEMIKHFSKLEVEHLNLQLKYQHLLERFGNKKSVTSSDAPAFKSVFEIGHLKEQLQGRGNTIRELKVKISRLQKKHSEAEPILDFKALDSQNKDLNAKVNALHDLNKRFRVENKKVKQHYKELYDSIKLTHAKTIEKTTSLLTKIETLKAQIKGKTKCITMPDPVKPKFLAPCMYAINVEPIPPRNRNNREVHLDYLKHFKESIGTLFEIVEEARELLEYVIGTCPKDFNNRDRKIPTAPLHRKKRVTFVETDMMKSSPICLLSKASKTKSWLWHRWLNHLNFGTINDLARKDLVRGLPRLKFENDHLCSACKLGKSQKYSHKPKSKNTNLEVLNTLHMDLCGLIRVQRINGKKNILVIVDDYSRFTWVKFLRSKDETLEFVIKFLKQIQVSLNKTVRYIHTNNGTYFVNQVLTEYYESVGIFHQKLVSRTPQQNSVVERRNRTRVEATRTMLIFSKAPMFLWAEVVATACYTQN
ncbi:retrovirus-related pol polyprotein from transposon TNT 1-94 [Tanacetum coccineum]